MRAPRRSIREDTPLRAALSILLLALGLVALAPAGEPPAVSASPPKEAVPAPPVTASLQRRIQRCNATAEARQLHGTERRDFLRGCVAVHHTPARSASAGTSASSASSVRTSGSAP